MKIIFLDIDGVLNNSGCYRPGNHDPMYGQNPDPKCVAALNRITDETGALIVVSSTWRLSGLMTMRETLKHWGVKASVLDITPRLQNFKGDTCLSRPRGEEIQTWLNRAREWRDIESFVILDDDDDMVHLTGRLVKTDFSHGLTAAHADKAIGLLATKTEAVEL